MRTYCTLGKVSFCLTLLYTSLWWTEHYMHCSVTMFSLAFTSVWLPTTSLELLPHIVRSANWCHRCILGWMFYAHSGLQLASLAWQIHCPKSNAYFQGISRSVYGSKSPWPVNFRRRFNPPPFGNFRKHLTHHPSEISEKYTEETKIKLAGFDLLSCWLNGSCSNLYTIAPG